MRSTWRSVEEARLAISKRHETNQWATRRQELVRLLATAESASSLPAGPRQWLGLQLSADEREILSLPNVELVEPRAVERSSGRYAEIGLNTPLSVKIGAQRGQTSGDLERATVIDRGNATITNRRVLFSGPRQTRAFGLDELVDVRVAIDEPLVYFHRRDREGTTGIRFPVTSRQEVVDHLQIAIALSRGEADALIESLRNELRTHEARRPIEAREKGPGADQYHSSPAPAEPSGLYREQPDAHQGNRLPSPDGREGARVAKDFIREGAGVLWRLLRDASDRRPRRASGEVAGLARRSTARLVDLLLYVFLGAFVTLPFQMTTSTGESTVSNAGVVVWIGTSIVLEIVFCATTGRSLGKRLLRLSVVDAESGQPPSVRQSALRTVVSALLFVSVLGPFVSWLVAQFDGDRRSVQDRAAHTLVRLRPGRLPTTPSA
jgi:uncharacterized RDD family membrane protein YckC